MILQRVGGVVGRADDLDVRARYNLASGKLGHGERVGGERPHFVAGVGAEYALPAEIAAQLQMRPVVERIARQFGHCRSISAELFVIRRIAGDIFLRDSA